MIDILPSKRKGIYYLEFCKISQVDERIVYNRVQKAYEQFFSIPEKNTSVLLLGSGTSITQAAMRQLGDAGVIVGFTGGGGVPLFMASQSEYRPNEYFFAYLNKWQDKNKTLEMAKLLQIKRIHYVNNCWSAENKTTSKNTELFKQAGQEFESNIKLARTEEAILGYESNYAKSLYKIALNSMGHNGDFRREHGKKDSNDLFNSYLDNGNYLAYGLASVALWVLGIPFNMAVLHGKTRRGALVFDIADVIKDAVIMPAALEAAYNGDTRSDMRKQCIQNTIDNKSLDYLFNTIKEILV